LTIRKKTYASVATSAMIIYKNIASKNSTWLRRKRIFTETPTLFLGLKFKILYTTYKFYSSLPTWTQTLVKDLDFEEVKYDNFKVSRQKIA
jgi:hypothetical protein